MFFHQVTIAFLRKRFSFFDRLRESSSFLAGIFNYNLDFWLSITPIAVSVSFTVEGNLKLMSSMILWCISLISLSVLLDGWDRCILAKWGFNPRKAYNIIYNKKIIDLIR